MNSRHRITLEFQSEEDLGYFQRYIKMAKETDGTVTGLYCGIMCAALKRSKVIGRRVKTT